MSQGTLYVETVSGEPRRTRAIVPAALVEHFKLPYTLSGPDDIYPSKFPARLVPSFAYPDGSTLVESIPICLKLAKDTNLVPTSPQEHAEALQWMNLLNSEFMPALTTVFTMLIGRAPYEKEKHEAAKKSLARFQTIIEARLRANTFLVGEKVTIADLLGVTFYMRGLEHYFDAKWRAENPATTRWLKTIMPNPIFGGFFDKLQLCEVAKQPPS